MSDTYNYEEGAVHNDHKKVLQIGSIGLNDVGKLLGAFFGSNIEDAVIEEDIETERRQDDEAMKKAKVLTGNAKFMTIMQKAVEQGFCQQDGWQYKWKKKMDAVYFSSQASHKFNLSNYHDQNGDIKISWQPFEALFDGKDFRSKFNDYIQGKIKQFHKEEIDKLLR